MLIDTRKLPEKPVPVKVAGYGHTEIAPAELVTNDQYIRKLPAHVRAEVYEDQRLKLPPEEQAAAPECRLHEMAMAKVVEVAGVQSRRESPKRVEELAAEAGRMALEHAGVEPADIDFVIVGTNTGTGYPSVADHVKLALGIKPQAACNDVQEACTSFTVALHDAYWRIRGGGFRAGLVLAAERATELAPIDRYRDHNLFGDDAAAMVVTAADRDHFVFLSIDSNPFDGLIDLIRKTDGGFTMQGERVHRYVGGPVRQELARILKELRIDVSSLHVLAAHQASAKTLDLYVRKLGDSVGLPQTLVVLRNIEQMGNTSSVSTPAMISRAVHAGAIRKGDFCVESAFGAGMSEGHIGFYI